MPEQMPRGAEILSDQLLWLGVESADRQAVLDWCESLDESQAARVDQIAESLVSCWNRRLDADFGRRPFTEDDEQDGPAVGSLVAIAVALASPRLHALNLGAGYSEEVSRDTLSDLGLQLAKHRRVHGVAGLATARWLGQVCTNGFARLGRLQFELETSDLGQGEPASWRVLSTHIPADGPLTPELVDESLLTASTWFEERYPQLAPIDWFTCYSWLLDPALAWRVPGGNIAAFCNRWDVWSVEENDRDAFFFGFDRELPAGSDLIAAVAELPRDNRLHRAMVEHWQEGEHFMFCRGRLPVIRQVAED